MKHAIFTAKNWWWLVGGKKLIWGFKLELLKTYYIRFVVKIKNVMDVKVLVKHRYESLDVVLVP